MDIQFPDSTLSIESDVVGDFIAESLMDDAQLVGTAFTDEALEESAILELVTVEDATHIATESGSWFDTKTWPNGQIPDHNARAIIPDGIAVTYDQASDTRLLTLRVDGELNFAADVDTNMVVDTLVVSPMGTLQLGSEQSPMQPGITAKIVIANNGPINTLWDPNQLSRGVVSLGAVNIYGQAKTPFVIAENVPAAGDSRVILETVPKNWQVGDTLVIAAPKQADDPLAATEERVKVAAIAGNRVTFDRPLQFDHEANGAADIYIANVSRNVVIETENSSQLPSHQRGHVLLAGSDAIDIRYAEFRELGRTNHTQPLDSPLLGQSDRTNRPGRYALHLNQVGNPATDSPATLVGNSIVGSPGWGYVQADSHTRLDHNAVYDVIGAGFVAATDQESGHWLNNLAIKAAVADGEGSALALDGGNITADFWPQGTIASQGNISTEVGPLAATAIAAANALKAVVAEASVAPPGAADGSVLNEAAAASGGQTTMAAGPSNLSVLASSSAASTDSDHGLILHWTLDDSSGQMAQDASGQDRDGSLKKGASWTDQGLTAGALQLNGKGQVVRDTDAETYLNGLDAITLAMWVKSDQVGTDRGFLSTVKPTGNDQNLGIRYDDRGTKGGGDDVIKFGLRTTQGVVEYESAANVQTQEWQHIVLSWRSGAAPQLYLNGQMDQPTAAAPAIGGTLSGITDFIVGQGQHVWATWDGSIDDVRIYDRALDTAAVSALYNPSDIPNLSPVINPPQPPTADLPDEEPTLVNHLERQLRSKDLGALQEIYNVTFNERGKPDVHIGMAASDVIMLKVQQNEFIGEARERSEMVNEPFNLNLTKDNVEIVGPNGKVFRPTAVHRKSKVADAAKENFDFILDHYFHLELPRELDPDAEYTVRFKNGNLDNINFTPEDNVSLAIHHPRAYDVTTPQKVAKLSSWMSKQGGGVDYQEGTPFQVIDEATGRVVHSGGITLDAANDKVAGTDVYSLDFSAVQKPGTYRIEVDGVGKSLPFQVRHHVWEDMLDLSMEGLYVHRAFAKLEQPYTDFVRPGNSGIVFHPTRISEADVEIFDQGDRFKVVPQNADRSKTLKLKGGWFDAGDYDTRSVHMETVSTLVNLYNTNPGYFQRFNPNIPESGDGIPDILNEAMWGLRLYKQLQRPDGAVSAGYEFDSHPAGTRSWEEKEAFVWEPDFRSSYRFAAAAAKMSTAIAPYNPKEANDLKRRAARAFDWAEQDFAAQSKAFKTSGKANEYRQLAAVEVYRVTGKDQYHDVFRSINSEWNHEASFVYAQLDPKIYTAVDTRWQEQLRNRVIQNGNDLVRFGEQSGFDTVNNPAYDQNWGFNTVVTNKHSHFLAMAHQLTGDAKYLDTLAQSMPFGMGMNPDNLSFTTGTKDRGLAYDEVEAILHDDGRAMDQVPDGITAYGFYSRNWFAWPTINKATNNTFFNNKSYSLDVPLIEAFNDYHLLIPSTEYTIHQTIDDQIFANGYLASQVAKQPSAARRSADALTGMSLSRQVAGAPNVNDALTNYAASHAASLNAAVEPSADGNFLTLEGATANTQNADAIALSAIGNSALNDSEDSAFGDGLAAVTGTSPLEVDPIPQPVAV